MNIVQGCAIFFFLFGNIGLAAAQSQIGAGAPEPVYVSRAVVTGTDERDRPRGLAICLGQVLINVSGDPNILHRAGVSALLPKAEMMVTGLDYVDRMSGMHKHDEQGTRDRPFTLTATFDPVKISAALGKIHVQPWTGPRPGVFLVVNVHGYAGNFLLTSGPPGASGYDMPDLMRDSVQDAAWQYKIAVSMPKDAVAVPTQGEMTVHGTLTWSDAAHGWIVAWQVNWQNHVWHWGARGVGFDDAFRIAMAGALGVAAGHGTPKG